jgi:uncharacterized protein (TIGR00645 family)
MARPNRSVIQAAVFLSRWLLAPFLLGLLCCLILLIYRFFGDFFALAAQISSLNWHDLVTGVLELVDLALTANLILIVVFSTYENFIQKIDTADHPDWPEGLTKVGFGELKQKLMASIVGIASVDALAWYFDLEKYSDMSKLVWVLAFPVTFAVIMLMLAVADRLGHGNGPGAE